MKFEDVPSGTSAGMTVLMRAQHHVIFISSQAKAVELKLALPDLGWLPARADGYESLPLASVFYVASKWLLMPPEVAEGWNMFGDFPRQYCLPLGRLCLRIFSLICHLIEVMISMKYQ